MTRAPDDAALREECEALRAEVHSYRRNAHVIHAAAIAAALCSLFAQWMGWLT